MKERGIDSDPLFREAGINIKSEDATGRNLIKDSTEHLIKKSTVSFAERIGDDSGDKAQNSGADNAE
jgi:hypothetical protein